MMASSLEQTPALHPPPGMTSNLLNPESLWKWDVLCVTICLFFTTVPFVLRTYTRIFIKKIWIFEDCKIEYKITLLANLLRYDLSVLGWYNLLLIL